MVALNRQSPVQFGIPPLSTELHDNWTVAMEYENEGDGPWVVDLAHKVRWDLQDHRIDDLKPCDLLVPGTPGGCTFSGEMLINRQNGTQASIFHLGDPAPDMPDFPGFTDVTESTLFLALFGPKLFFMAEKLSNLDFMDPEKEAPFLLQGPFCQVPCQIVTLEKSRENSGGVLLTCSRGYGDSMVHGIFKAGEEFGLRPAGENRFRSWLRDLNE